MNIQAINILNELAAIQHLKELGAEIFLVGGIVRDHLVNKESKDIDIIVRNIDETTLKNCLDSNGNLASDDDDGKTGDSFGVFKFFPNEIKLEEAIDVALPRTERLMSDEEFAMAVINGDLKKGDHHKAFVVTSDHTLSIEDDLERRDITVNSIAINIDTLETIDPFNGVQDIRDGIIKATSNKSFSDDPLRMMRVIQFASRFGFRIENTTWETILNNTEDIKSITGERILTELDKIFTKGDKKLGLELLFKSGLSKQIFPNFQENKIHWADISETRADFFSLMCESGDEFKKIIKGDVDTAKGIDALNILKEGILSIDIENNEEILFFPNKVKIRHIIFNSIQKSESVLDSGMIRSNDILFELVKEFIDGKMPKTKKHIAVNGHDLMSKGFKGIKIGEKHTELLNDIFSERVENIKEKLLNIL